MKATIIVLSTAALLVGSAAGLLFLAHAEPSTVALDADLAAVRSAAQAAEREFSLYQGGALKALIDLRKEIYRTTEAMLVQKREAWLRRIDLGYTAEGRPLGAANADKVAAITSDIQKANAKLASDEANASRFSGGLLQAMSLVTVATDRLSVSQLELTLYAAKYGLAPPLSLDIGGQSKAGPPGAAVKDKDAF